ncbi:ABC transporter ATP-binding protein [Streptomyces sp. FH025]|uniref:ABC transporter ATP-binding protein n=1 Tax=Streptomyces sp. FH025 TaxID=2815937 RepID=UPI001A9D199A|nr:ABC transporter ATP-binding protein [Streptomyces sp. FH025]MBO1413151.1 ABC transporter ATP-binding protein [Streptomyces sp. FH025]
MASTERPDPGGRTADDGPPGPPAVAVRGLRVSRGGRTVLHGLDLDVERGSVTGLLGPSGCGKTTLLRAVVGVQKVEAGRVQVLGADAGSPELRSRIGYVTQAPSVYADLSVAENLRYYADVLGAPRDDPSRTLEQVGLRGRERDLVGRLSGGQRARVSLAAALLGTPELLVLDEPTVGLDPVLRQDLWHLFHRLAAGGTTLLVSSHVMDEAERCTRLLLMRDGRLLADDTPAGLLTATGAPDVEQAFLRLVTGSASPAGDSTAHEAPLSGKAPR